MEVLVFDTHSDEIERVVKAEFSGHPIEICTTVNRFARKLFEDQEKDTIGVLLPADEEELIDVYQVREFFGGIPVMLVLPNRDKFAEAIGYRLGACVMCHRESNITEALSGLKNLTGSPDHSRFGNVTKVY